MQVPGGSSELSEGLPSPRSVALENGVEAGVRSLYVALPTVDPCGHVSRSESSFDGDVTANLKGELAALQVKCKRLQNEVRPSPSVIGNQNPVTRRHSNTKAPRESCTTQVEESQSLCATRESRLTELQRELHSLQELTARQSSIIQSLRVKIQGLEERNYSLSNLHEKEEHEAAFLRRENRELQEKVVDLDIKIRSLSGESSERKEEAEKSKQVYTDLMKKLGGLLRLAGIQENLDLVQSFGEIVQENASLRTRVENLQELSERRESERRTSRDTVSRLISELEMAHRERTSFAATVERLKQELEDLGKEKLRLARETDEKEARLDWTRKESETLEHRHQEALKRIHELEGELSSTKQQAEEEDCRRKNWQESVSLILRDAFPDEPNLGDSGSITACIQTLVSDNQDRKTQIDALCQRISGVMEDAKRKEDELRCAKEKTKDLEEEVSRLRQKTKIGEDEAVGTEILKERLRKTQATHRDFLERLSRAMRLEELTRGDFDLDLDLGPEAIVARAEQLVRLEGDQLHSKSVAVHELQRKLRAFRSQAERKDLQLDVLRRKITSLEDRSKEVSSLQRENEAFQVRSKKMAQQVERYQAQLREEQERMSILKDELQQMSDAKVKLLERDDEFERLRVHVLELEAGKSRMKRKLTALKMAAEEENLAAMEDRRLSDNAIDALSAELDATKLALSDARKREKQLEDFRTMIGRVLGLDSSSMPLADFQMIRKLENMARAHQEFTLLSKKFSCDNPDERARADEATSVSRRDSPPHGEIPSDDQTLPTVHWQSVTPITRRSTEGSRVRIASPPVRDVAFLSSTSSTSSTSSSVETVEDVKVVTVGGGKKGRAESAKHKWVSRQPQKRPSTAKKKDEKGPNPVS
ncbi:unnamed protein product [Darwinula stevensoni]|uniref:Coiled-coil domain-containing protein 170 n=1 Tax=Darwinula stevensoni TaxID=69355 RepID=A0A7R8XDW6_9CRUS|nr:unnamed protein product [Darwinula stevensoni]CAG0890015.1 unnamed protein product [Darwinula stevensoni]